MQSINQCPLVNSNTVEGCLYCEEYYGKYYGYLVGRTQSLLRTCMQVYTGVYQTVNGLSSLYYKVLSNWQLHLFLVSQTDFIFLAATSSWEPPRLCLQLLSMVFLLAAAGLQSKTLLWCQPYPLWTPRCVHPSPASGLGNVDDVVSVLYVLCLKACEQVMGEYYDYMPNQRNQCCFPLVLVYQFTFSRFWVIISGMCMLTFI